MSVIFSRLTPQHIGKNKKKCACMLLEWTSNFMKVTARS